MYCEKNGFGRAGDNRKRRAFSRFKFEIDGRGKISEVYQMLVHVLISGYEIEIVSIGRVIV